MVGHDIDDDIIMTACTFICGDAVQLKKKYHHTVPVQAELAIHFNSGASFCGQEYQLLRLTKKIFLYVIYLTNLLGVIPKDEVPFLPVYYCF